MRVPQWIIDLEAPVDVTALLRDNEDEETAIVKAELATQILEGTRTRRPFRDSRRGDNAAHAGEQRAASTGATGCVRRGNAVSRSD